MTARPSVRPYEGVRILDLTRELGSYSARLFADLGAEVIKVEPPGGAPERRESPVDPAGTAIPFRFLNINKKSITLDLGREDARSVLYDLVAASQVVFLEAGGGREALLADIAAVPGARVTTIYSYFGLIGPYAEFVGSDLVAQALGGIVALSGELDKPPLQIAGRQSLFVTSLYGAAATAIALWDCERTGLGHVVDVAAQECIAHSLQNAVQVYDLEGRIARRGGEGTRDATESAFRCSDGFVFLAAPLALSVSWGGLLAWMRDEGSPAFARLSEPDWADRPRRATEPMKREFRALFEDFIRDRSKAELREIALKRKICMAPVSRIADLTQDPQLAFRNYFGALPDGTLVPGAPYRLSEPLWRIDGDAPLAGQDNRSILGFPAAAAVR